MQTPSLSVSLKMERMRFFLFWPRISKCRDIYGGVIQFALQIFKGECLQLSEAMHTLKSGGQKV